MSRLPVQFTDHSHYRPYNIHGHKAGFSNKGSHSYRGWVRCVQAVAVHERHSLYVMPYRLEDEAKALAVTMERKVRKAGE